MSRPVRRDPAERSRKGPRSGIPAEELEAFYRAVYLPLVRRATWKHRLSCEDARDIVQDAFVLALTRMSGTGNPRAWLVQVVDHLALNYRRKLTRRSHLAKRWGYVDETDGPEARDAGDHTSF